MALLAGTAIVGGLSSGFQMYQGHKQKKAGEEALANLDKPVYNIPQEYYDQLSDAEKKQVEGLTAEQKSQFVKQMDRQRAASLKSSADRKGGLMGLQQSANQETDALLNLTQMDAAARKQSELDKQAAIERARGNIAMGKDKQFGVQEGRYQADLASAQGQIGAGQQNFMGGVQGLASTALGTMGMAYNPGGN